MNVLHLTTHINAGGITKYILQCTQPLIKKGVNVHVLSSGGEWEGQLQKAGAQTHTINIRTKSELDPKLIFALPKLVQIVQENKIDLIHAHSRVTQVLAARLQKKISIPVVTTCHGYFQNRLGRRLWPCWGDHAIAISDPVAENLRSVFQVPNEKITTVWNGVDVDFFDTQNQVLDSSAMKQKFGFDEDTFVFGVTGRLVHDKGHHVLLQAFSQLKLKNPKIRLLIVGDGPEKEELKKLTHRLGCEDQVCFTGTVSNVVETLVAMDAFVFPATWREGFGLSIAEAMVMNLPVITTKIEALQSMIQEGHDGLLVSPNDVSGLFQAMLRLLEEKNLGEQIAQNGRELAASKYTLTQMVDGIYGVYNRQLRNA